MKVKKLLALFLIFSMVLAGHGNVVTAKAEEVYVEVKDSKSKVIDVKAGETKHVKLPVISKREYIENPGIVLIPDANAPFVSGDVTMTKDNITSQVLGISPYDTTYLEFDLSIKDTAKIGVYTANISFTFNLYEYNSNSYILTTATLPISVRVTEEKAPIQITIDKIAYNEDAALNTYMCIDYKESGMIPGYTVENIKIGELKSGQSTKISFPVKVLASAKEGLQLISANFTYKDSEGNEKSITKSIYITLRKTSTGTSEDAKLTIESSSVNDKVLAGSSYQLKGTVENIGKKDATNIVVSIAGGVGVTNGIIPDYETDGIKLSDITASESDTFTLPLLVTDSATEGLQEISVQVT